jgi:O-antigen/teichoic acid export membrane protein
LIRKYLLNRILHSDFILSFSLTGLKKKYKSFLSNFISSELLRSTSVLISGTVVAQIVPILLQPFLRRFFSPEAFGAYSVYVSIVGILIVISSLKYELAIVLPKRDKDAINLVALSVAVNFIFCLALLIVILIFKVKILKLINIPEKYSIVIYIIPLGTFLVNTFQSFNYWLIRKKAFISISFNKLVRRGFEGCSQVILAFFKNAKGLLWGDIAGQAANIVTVLFQSIRNGYSFRNIGLYRIKYVAGRYSEFPRYNLIPGFMSACSFMLPAVLINKFYSSEYTGYFDLSKLVLSIPLALVASSVSSVLLQRVSEKYQAALSFMSEIKPILFVILFISVFEILIISFFGIDLFKFIFGDAWGFSGEISELLVWSYALNFFVSSFSSIFISMRKIKLYSIWQVFYFLGILVLVLFRKMAFIEFLRFYVLIEVFCYTAAAALLILLVFNFEKKIRLAGLAN